MTHRVQRVLRRTLRESSARRESRQRLADADDRVLPDFLVIGAQKAGTTSLFEYLIQHDRVAAPRTKEVHYFTLFPDRGEQWYRSMFPRQDEVPAGGQTGEATPYYLFHPLAPRRAAEALPGGRMVALLRDPVERAWSHYRHEVAGGREPLPFARALDLEEERLADATAVVDRGGVAHAHQNWSYTARGVYADQLVRWFDAVGRDRVEVVVAEDMFSDPGPTYDGILRFLGLPDGHRPTFEAHNARRDSGLDPLLRDRLRERFRESNGVLADLLGRELPWPS